MNSTSDTKKWEVIEHSSESLLPQLYYEIVVRDWGLPLIGDYQGSKIAFVAGDYNTNDPESRNLALNHALRIASLPTLEAENKRLRAELDDAKQETARLVKKLHWEQDYAAFLENKHSEGVDHE